MFTGLKIINICRLIAFESSANNRGQIRHLILMVELFMRFDVSLYEDYIMTEEKNKSGFKELM